MDAKRDDEKFSAKEAQQRFEAALRGAFATSPKPLKSMPPKGKKAQAKKGTKK
jgi:hypothetical protein